MPMGQISKGGYKTSYRKRPAKKGPSNKDLNKKINHIKNNLIELKDQDVFNNGSVITNTGLLINGMNLTGSRSGNDIQASSLTMKAIITSDIDTLVPSHVRCIVFWDRQPNGANAVLIGANGLLENNIVTNLVVSPRNYDTIERYKILDDFTFVLNPQQVFDFDVATGTTTTVIPVSHEVNRYYKLNRQMKYDAQSSSIADSMSNTINVAFFGDLAANQATLLSGIRLYYKD